MTVLLGTLILRILYGRCCNGVGWPSRVAVLTSIEEVLQCLESVWGSSKSPYSVDETTTTEEDEVPTVEEDGVPMTVEHADDLNFANYSPGKFPHFTYYEAS